MSDVPERPRLAARARLSFDRHSGRHLLLYPEKGLELNESSAEIAKLCTGERRVTEIIDALSARHPEAPRARLEHDVIAFLTSLAARGLLRETP